jgi:DNA repair protein RadA/Sms
LPKGAEVNHNQKNGLLAVDDMVYPELPLSGSLRWLRDCVGQVVAGATYLVAGQPGIGKSRLSLQLALDLARGGNKALYIMTEEPKSRLKARAEQMCGQWSRSERETAMINVLPEDTVYDLEVLPQFLARQVLNPSGPYHGVKLIVLDSVQGHGLHSAATRKYKQLYEFCRHCQSAGITTFLVTHVTKKGDIAGPKDLEHNVDCTMVMRKAMVYRPLFIPKNRFGPAVLKPLPLLMNPKTTELRISPHQRSVSSVARTYLGRGQGVGEIQASVSLPSYGTRGRITAPNLPRKEIEQLTSCISSLDDMELGDLDYSIHCRLPGDVSYSKTLGLPLCLALIGSYLQRDLPERQLHLGEIDLLRNVRPVSDRIIQELVESVKAGEISLPVEVLCAPGSKALLDGIPGINASSCQRLEDAVYRTWPDLQPESQLLN